MTCDTGTLASTDITQLAADVKTIKNWVQGGASDSFTLSDGTVVPSPLKVVTDSLMFKGPPIAWTPALSVTDALQTYSYLGVIYRPNPTALPFTTPGTFLSTNWIVLQDRSVSYDSLYELITNAGKDEDAIYHAKGFYTGVVGGGGPIYWSSTENKANANGVTIIDPSALNGWTGSRSNIETTFHDATSGQGTGTGTGCFIRIYETISVLDAGAVGDSADSYRAFLAAGSVGEVVFVPAPAVDYELSAVPAGEFRSDESITLTGAGSSLVIGRRMTTKDFIGQDTTLVVGVDYATLALTLAYLDTVRLMPGIYVTVTLATEALTDDVVIDHPDADRIQFIGAAPVTSTISAVGAVTGSTAAWSMQFTVADTTGMTTGDWAFIDTVVGTGSYEAYSGFFPITVDDATHVTVINTSQMTAWPTATLSSANITCLKTKITFVGAYGFDCRKSVHKIDQVAIIGNSTDLSVGIHVGNRGTDLGDMAQVNIGPSTGVALFDWGIVASYGSNIDWRFMRISTCKTACATAEWNGSIYGGKAILTGQSATGPGSNGAGAYAYNNGSIKLSDAILTGNKRGAWMFAGGSMYSTSTARIIANAGDGCLVQAGGVARCASSESHYNTGNGFSVIGGSLYAPSSKSTYNGANGYYCEGGEMHIDGTTANNNTTKDWNCLKNGTITAANAVGDSTTSSMYAQRHGYIYAVGSTGIVSYSPTVNTHTSTNNWGTIETS